MKKMLVLIASALIAAHPLAAVAEIVVVVPVKSSVDKLSKSEVINIFMGRYRVLPDGSAANPVDLPIESPDRRLFYRKLLDKSLEEVNAYWARLVFAGKTSPPSEVKSREALGERLANTPGALGYIDRRYLTKDMRVVLVLPD